MKDIIDSENINKNKYKYKDFVYRFVFKYIESNMYIIIENSEALIIDPHYSEEVEAFLDSNKIRKCLILLTHEHFDHTSGINWFQNKYETRLICQKEALDEKSQYICNRPRLLCVKLAYEGKEKEAKKIENEFQPYSYSTDEIFDDELKFQWNNHSIYMKNIPGHSPASSLIWVDDEVVFTGDSLIPNTPPTLKWPRSNSKVYESSFEIINKISQNVYVFPGHGEPQLMANLERKGFVFYTKDSKDEY